MRLNATKIDYLVRETKKYLEHNSLEVSEIIKPNFNMVSIYNDKTGYIYNTKVPCRTLVVKSVLNDSETIVLHFHDTKILGIRGIITVSSLKELHEIYSDITLNKAFTALDENATTIIYKATTIESWNENRNLNLMNIATVCNYLEMADNIIYL